MTKTFLILSSCVALALGARGAEMQKVATINLKKVFDGYYRTKQADATLKEQAADLEKETKTMLDQFHKNEEKYRKLLDGANDQALSQPERDKRKREAENELLGLRDLEAKIKQFDATSRTQLLEKNRRVRDNLITEIQDQVKAIVKKSGHTLVVDTAAEAANGTPIVLFSAGTDDITDTVLAQLNVNAPPPSAGKADAKPEKGLGK